MKRASMVILMLVFSITAFAENPLIGKWKMYIIGMEKYYEAEFTEENEMILENSEEKGEYTYENNSVSIPIFNEISSSFELRKKDDYIDLIINDKASPIISNVVVEFVDKYEGLNEFNDEVSNNFGNGIRELFLTYPIIRLEKINE